jgi:RNA polymerase sigma-70 factor, ECF subfamily
MPSDEAELGYEGEAELLEGLRQGEEAAFATLVASYSSALLRLAMTFVPSRAVAEEVVQETWLGVIKGLDRFEGRSSLKTWIFRILTNTARTRGMRERRSVPFSSLAAAEADEGPVVDPDRFLPQDHRFPGGWALAPMPWPTPEEGLLADETREVVLAAVEELRPAQRTVITLRDLEGWPSEEVCEALEISEGNQRVLLHRARSRVRAALERHFDAVEPNPHA